MKRLLSIVLAACALAAAFLLPGSSAQGEASEREKSLREAWVYESMLDMGQVKVGQTRAELLKVFGEEGGLSTRTQRTYVFRGCRYFKVNVKFEPVGEVSGQPGESPDDKVVEISKPYLDYSVLD